MAWPPAWNHALNIRPCPPALREALHALAKAQGLQLYQYVLAVLTQHVAAQQDQPPIPARGRPAGQLLSD